MVKNLCTFISILFVIFLIKEAKSFEEEVLERYSSIKTKYSSIIVNTSEFQQGDDIYLALESDSKCDDYIRYQFYDNISNIYNQTSDLKYNMRAGSRAETNVFGKKTHLSLYYTINKKSEVLENIKGNILYIEFKCEGEVEIKNTKKDASVIYGVIGLFICIIFLIIFCFLFIKGCLFWICCLRFCCKRNTMYNRNNFNNIQNLPNFNNRQLYMNQIPSRIVNISQEQNIPQNNYQIYNVNYSNIPNYPPQQQNSENSSSEAMNSTDRNLVQ